MDARKPYSESSHYNNHSRSDHSRDNKGYDREDRRDSKFDRKDDRRDSNRHSSTGFMSSSDYQYNGFSKSLISESKDQLVNVEKNFYKESDHVRSRHPEDVKAFRDSVKIAIKSEYAPNPITSFQESSFPPYILDVLQTKGFQKPTPIQSQGWPIVLKGHDLIGIAQTGSGKTIGFLLPGIVHMKAQEPLRRGDGPIGLVLAPTRELAMQIYEEFKPFGNTSRLRATCLYGGAEKYPQRKDLRSGCELVIATPGRLIDFLEAGDTNLKRVSFLVIDEADRMLDMGFVPQIEKIVQYIRKDRQTLMWSATWPQEVRRLADDLCREKPIHIVVGSDDLAVNKAVSQLVKVVSSKEKFDKFLRLMRGIYDGSKILVFCQTKKTSDWVSRTLQNEGYKSVAIHGDKSQKDRDNIMGLFKDQRVPILVATNLAARGLDVKDIRFVINYDFPSQLEEYVHRVGRTGRGGATGTSFTFFTQEDGKNAKGLIKILIDNNQKVPDELYDLVHDKRFREKMMRYDRGQSNRDVKDFSDYEKSGPSNHNNSSNRTPHHAPNEYRGAPSRSYQPSRPSYPQTSFPTTTNPSQPTTQIINTTMTAINPMYNMSQQMTPQQQYAMMAQMQMVQLMQQQYPGQMSAFGTQQGQLSTGIMQPGSSTEPKKDVENVASQEPIANAGAQQYNGNSYYRDIYNSHGTSYYSTQNESTMNLPKRTSGSSRFTDVIPTQQGESNGVSQPLNEQHNSNANSNKQGVESEY